MPVNDDWKSKYDFNPKDAKVTMPLSRDSCPTVSPFVKKAEDKHYVQTDSKSTDPKKCCSIL